MDGALEPWTDFNVAVAGATAALAGLIIVAMSVNMAEILKGATLPARAAASIATLVLAIVASCLGLIPGQPLWAIGVELLVGITVPWWMEGHAIRVIARDPETPAGTRWPKSVVGVLPLLAYSVGVVLLLASSPAGLVLVAVGSILAIISAVVFAWVVLVEILR